MLRILAILAVVVASAWGAYWFVGARALDRAVAQSLVESPNIVADAHSVRGFPNRFDLTIDAPRLEGGGARWQAPFVQVFALSYKPHHLIVVFPNDQQFTIAGHTASLHTEDARASLVMTPGLSLPLERMALVATEPRLQTDGATHTAGALRIASRSQDARLHEVVAELETAFPDPAWMDDFDPEGNWPRRFDALRLEGRAQFDRPLDRTTLEGPLPRPVAVALTGARVRFDGVDLDATGEVEPDANGRLSGPLTLRVTGWPALLQRLTEAGLIDANQAGVLRPMLAGMAAADSPDLIELSLTLREGTLSLGPLSLIQLPPLF